MASKEKAVRVADNLSRLADTKTLLLQKIGEQSGFNPNEFTVIKLNKVEAVGTNTSENSYLRREGLIRGGFVNIPVLLVVPKSGWLEAFGADHLRIEFKDFYGSEVLGRFCLGFDNVDKQVNPVFEELTDFTLSREMRRGNTMLGLKYEPKEQAESNRRTQTEIFEIEPPAGMEFLFNQKGRLRDGQSLEKVAVALSRRVDLDPASLTDDEEIAYRELYPGGFDEVKKWFILIVGADSEQLVLDGDIPVEMSLEPGETVNEHIIIRIKNIQVPDFDIIRLSELHQIVRPREENPKGNLIITLSENGNKTSFIEKAGRTNSNIFPIGFIEPEKLTVILAKLARRPNDLL